MSPTGTSSVAITPQGIRDGDPAVLAALVGRRGPAVVAFASTVCEPQYVVRAAADAFARFRAAVVDPSTDMNVHPDALLLRCGRRAALELAPRGPELGCGPALDLLIARAERTIAARDSELLNRHLESCEHCSDLSRRLDAADRAYREAGDTDLDPATIAPMVAAMAAAAPLAPPTLRDPSPPAAPISQGSGPATEAGEAPEAAAVLPSGPHDSQTQDGPAGAEEPALSDVPETAEEPALSDEPVAAEAPAAVEAVAVESEEDADAREPGPATEASPPLAEEEPEATPEEGPTAEAEAEPEPQPPTSREIPIGTRRVTGAPSSYYQIPSPPPRGKSSRAQQAKELRRRVGRAARKRLDRAPAPTPPPQAMPEPEPEVSADEMRVWRPVDSIEFPAVHHEPEPEPAPPGPEEPAAHLGFPALEITPSPYDEPEMRDSAAKAAARHYRRLRHQSQQQEAAPPDGKPPRLERPKRDRGPHLPLSAHGPRHLALPAGLLVVAALVIMAISGVFGGGSESPPTGTAAKAPPEVSLVTQSATSISLTDAERVAARAGGTQTP